MSPFRQLLLVTVSAIALCGVQACSTETELNPQPLPPQGGSENTPSPAQDPGDKNGDSTGGGSSGSSGSSGTPTSAADSGADGAPDGGTDAHDSGAD